MKVHVIIACLVGILAVGYVLVAPRPTNVPDSVESIAQQRERPATNEASLRLRLNRGFLAIV